MTRFAALWAFITGKGQPPEWARHPAAVVGLLILAATVAVFVRHTWSADPTIEIMGYVAIFVLLGLALMKIGGKSE